MDRATRITPITPCHTRNSLPSVVKGLGVAYTGRQIVYNQPAKNPDAEERFEPEVKQDHRKGDSSK